MTLSRSWSGARLFHSGAMPERFWKNVFVAGEQVGQFHALVVRITSRPQHVPLQVNRVLVVRGDWKDMNLVAVLNFERSKLRRRLASWREVQAEHGPILVRFQTLNFDMP